MIQKLEKLKKKYLNRKNFSNKTKDTAIENELKKLKTFDLRYFRGKNYFDEDGFIHFSQFLNI